MVDKTDFVKTFEDAIAGLQKVARKKDLILAWPDLGLAVAWNAEGVPYATSIDKAGAITSHTPRVTNGHGTNATVIEQGKAARAQIKSLKGFIATIKEAA